MGSTIRADLAPVTDLADDLAGPLIKTMLDEASDTIRKDVLKVGQQATGGDLRLSRYRGGGRMTVDVKVSGKRSTIDLEPPGLWALATGGAKPHYIGPGSRTRGGRARRKHPGFKGRNGLGKVWATIPRTVTDTVEETLDKAMPLMAVETRVIIDANASNAIKEIGKLDQAAADADTTIKALDDQTVTVDVNADGMDELRRQGDEAIAAVKALDAQTVTIDIDTDRLDTVKTKLDGVESSGRASGTAIGAVGNSISELPGVGALGPIAESLGQLTENALEGGESISGITKALGVMGGAAVALQVISKAMESIAETKAFNKKQVGDFSKALRDGATFAEAVNDQLRETEQIIGRVDGFAGMFEGSEDIVDDLVAMGFKVDDVTTALAGTDAQWKAFIGPMKADLDALKAAPEEGFLGILQSGEQTDKLNSLRDTIEVLTETRNNNATAAEAAAAKEAFYGDKVDETTDSTWRSTEAFGGAKSSLDKLMEGFNDTAIAIDGVKRANAELRGDLDKREAYLNLLDSFDELKIKGGEAMDAVKNKTGDAESKMRDYEQAQIDVKQEVIDYTEKIGEIPTDITTDLVTKVDSGELDTLKHDVDILTLGTKYVDVRVRTQFDAAWNQMTQRITGFRP